MGLKSHHETVSRGVSGNCCHKLTAPRGRVLLGGVSVVNDNVNDNRFHQGVGRFPENAVVTDLASSANKKLNVIYILTDAFGGD